MTFKESIDARLSPEARAQEESPTVTCVGCGATVTKAEARALRWFCDIRPSLVYDFFCGVECGRKGRST